MYLDAYLHRPLPVPDADRVVALSAASADVRDRSLLRPNYRDLRERLQAFDGVVAHRRVSYSFARSRAMPARCASAWPSAAFLQCPRRHAGGRDGCSRTPRRGRDRSRWSSSATTSGAARSAPIPTSSATRSGSTGPAADRRGVAAGMFTGMDAIVRPAFYVPAPLGARLAAGDSDSLNDRAAARSWCTAACATASRCRRRRRRWSPLWAALRREYPDVTGRARSRCAPSPTSAGRANRTARRSRCFVMLLAGVVLIIACANVANLLAQLAHERAGEIALRVALGAGRFRLLRQLLAETVGLAAVGGVVGVGIAFLAIRVIGGIEGRVDRPL